jgi:hypothetical protein
MSDDEGDLDKMVDEALAEGNHDSGAEDMEIDALFSPDNLDDAVSVFTYAMRRLVGSFTPWLAAIVDDSGVMHWFSNVRKKEKASVGLQLAIVGFSCSNNGTCDEAWLREFKSVMHSEHGRSAFNKHGAHPANYEFKATLNSLVSAMDSNHKKITWMFIYEDGLMRHNLGSVNSDRNYPIILLTRLALKFNDAKEPFIQAKEMKGATMYMSKVYREVIPEIESFLA